MSLGRFQFGGEKKTIATATENKQSREKKSFWEMNFNFNI